MHPGIDNLSLLSIQELEDKISQLNRYYFLAQAPEARQQIILLLDSYKLELEERKIAEKRNQQQDDNNDLDSLINIS